MKVYRLRDIVEEIEIDAPSEAEALTAVMNGSGVVIGLIRDCIVDAWDPKEDENGK